MEGAASASEGRRRRDARGALARGPPAARTDE